MAKPWNPGQWITGSGWDERKLAKHRYVIAADIDAGKISKEEFFVDGEHLLKERLQPSGSAKPAERDPLPALAISKVTTQPGSRGL